MADAQDEACAGAGRKRAQWALTAAAVIRRLGIHDAAQLGRLGFYPGEMAAQGTPLITVMDLSRVIAKAHIPQSEAAVLKKGDAATLTVPGSDEAIPAKLTVVTSSLVRNDQVRGRRSQPRRGASV